MTLTEEFIILYGKNPTKRELQQYEKNRVPDDVWAGFTDLHFKNDVGSWMEVRDRIRAREKEMAAFHKQNGEVLSKRGLKSV